MIYIKLVIVACLGFIGYNYWLNNHNTTAFETIFATERKEAILTKLGAPFNSYTCSGDNAPSYFYADRLCKQDAAAEVLAFEMCKIPLICPGWASITLNQKGQMIRKYHFTAQ